MLSESETMSRFFESWRRSIFDPDIPFRRKALDVFRHQVSHVPIYARFCDTLGIDLSAESDDDNTTGSDDDNTTGSDIDNTTGSDIDPTTGSGINPPSGPKKNPAISQYSDAAIPLMPIQVFRDLLIRPDYLTIPEAVFRSSGTSGSRQSTHEIADLTLYEESCLRGFGRFYDPEQFAVRAWLPGYSDNPNSSLVAMIDTLIRHDRSGLSRFLPLDQPMHESDFDDIREQNKRIMLFGAAFGLMDLVDSGAPALPSGSVVVETGGMKTRRREIPKQELHHRLAEGFAIPRDAVHSEYGMAEMCSQAWNNGSGWFACPPWLKITIRDPQYPMELLSPGKEGLIGVADLANVHSLSFILTQDRGVMRQDGTFQVLGRWDHAELRGCNFLMES